MSERERVKNFKSMKKKFFQVSLFGQVWIDHNGYKKLFKKYQTKCTNYLINDKRYVP